MVLTVEREIMQIPTHVYYVIQEDELSICISFFDACLKNTDALYDFQE